jgi:hypothetical protein
MEPYSPTVWTGRPPAGSRREAGLALDQSLLRWRQAAAGAGAEASPRSGAVAAAAAAAAEAGTGGRRSR